jgi:hypothetical protein
MRGFKLALLNITSLVKHIDGLWVFLVSDPTCPLVKLPFVHWNPQAHSKAFSHYNMVYIDHVPDSVVDKFNYFETIIGKLDAENVEYYEL